MESENKVLKGGEFLIAETDFRTNFIPEDLNEDQNMIRQTVRNFVDTDIRQRGGILEEQVSLLEKAASLGLLGSHMPEEFGGMALDTHSNTLISEELGRGDASFNTSLAAHNGIGMLPILYFGTEQQKKKYLPGLTNGSLKASYCLTEPGSGSDALSAKTRADLQVDGEHYLINGQKMWISNAGFADIFIVFAQIDGDKFSCFIVEKGTEGLTLGAEEHKLGIKGSSTRQVFFENVKVHQSQILGQIGKGHLIAFNVLNIGRYKLGTMTMGGSKRCIEEMVRYANNRVQFGHPISSYGAIQYKIAESIIRVMVAESTIYRVSDLMEDKKNQEMAEGSDYAKAMLKAAEEYAVECAIIKISGSEVLDYVVDEMLQTFGGYGFSEEYPAAKAYRDARINRIYEGTNEINRMLTINMILKRVMKGELDLVGPAWAVQKELTGLPSMEIPEGNYGLELRSLREFKKILLMVAGAAVKYQMDGKHDLKEQQELLMNIADIAIDVYNAESVYLRLMKLKDKSVASKLELFEAAMKTFFWDAQTRIVKNAQDALASFAEGDELRIMMMGVKRFSRYEAPNLVKMRRMVAAEAIRQNAYCL